MNVDAGMQPMLGASHYPPSFGYAQTTPHAQHRGSALLGNQLVSGGIGATQGVIQAAQMGVMGAGLVNAGSAGLTALGLMRAPVLASSLIGTGAGSGLAMGMVGGPVGLGLMAAGAGAGMAMHGVQSANQVGAMFGNMQFANGAGDPRTGRGFSQRDLMSLQRGIHAIDANNPFVSMSDAMRSADRFTEMGMHQGIQDAEKLAKKVTQLGKTLHSMARQLGTSMEEAGSFMRDMRGSGFYSAQDVMGNTSNMTLMRGFGMTSDQFAGMQRTGAGMTRSAMMSGRSGAGVITSKTAEFMSAIRSGAMNADQMMDITGAATPLEAAQMMAQQTLSGTMQGLSGGLGSAMLLAAGSVDKSGKFTGGVDSSLLQKMASGTMSRDEMLKIGGRKRDSREGQASFVAKKQDITESMLESDLGQEALFGMIRSLTEQKFGEGAGDDQDLFQLVAETQFNMDRRTVRNLQKLKDSRAQRMRDLAQELKTNERAADLKETRTLGGMVQRISGTFNDAYDTMAMPFSEYYRDITGGLQDVERTILGGGNDVSAGLSASGLESAMLRSTAASSRGEVAFTSGKNISIGEAARLAAVRNDPSLMRSALPGVSDSAMAAYKSSGVNLRDEMSILREQGGRLDARKMDELAVRLGLSQEIAPIKEGAATRRTKYNKDELYALLAKEGGDVGARLVAEANVSRTSPGESPVDIAAAQAQMSSALGGDRLLSNADGYGGGGKGVIVSGAMAGFALNKSPVGALMGAGLAGLGLAFDSDEEEAIEAIKKGGEGTGLLKYYGENSEEIDKMLQGVVSDADFEAAAEKVNARYGLKMTGADLKQVSTALTHASGNKTATERVRSPNKELAKSIGKAAAGIEDTVSAKKIKESLGALRGAARAAGATDTGVIADDETALGASIRQLAGTDYQGKKTGTAAETSLGFGVEIFRSLESAKEGGLTVAEISQATGLETKDIERLIGAGNLGSIDEGGAIVGDVEKIQSQISAAAAKGLSVSSKREEFLSSGMSDTERQSMSVYKTAEMVDAIWTKLKSDGVIKVSDPQGESKP